MTAPQKIDTRPLMPMLVALSGAHLLNDVIQSMIPALYPLFKQSFALDFMQIGLITLAFQVTSSLLQPLIGYITDKRPWPYAMLAGMTSTLIGLISIAYAQNYATVLLAASLVGLGSAVFHPEATRMARHAAAGQQGLAQGIFQIGGHVGYAAGPLLVAAWVVPRGQQSLVVMSVFGIAALVLMAWIGRSYQALRAAQTMTVSDRPRTTTTAAPALAKGTIITAMTVLMILLASKNGYTAAFTSFYTFYLIEKFGIGVQASQVMLFLFLVVGAIGVILGGMLGDRIGRDRVIWFSILGVLPFALALPYANLFWTGVLGILISLITSSAFSAILVYAIDLVPHRVGLVGGLFYGLSFGLGGIAAAALGLVADKTGVIEMFKLTAWLPALGLLAILLPRTHGQR
jgi:FSR family fosmidomycin resistance protein-like MFS transporter